MSAQKRFLAVETLNDGGTYALEFSEASHEMAEHYLEEYNNAMGCYAELCGEIKMTSVHRKGD